MDDIRKYPRPSVTVDLVIFTVHDGSLRVLLIRRGQEPWAGCWALPGGFVRVGEEVGPRQGEDLFEAAQRELEEETGIPARQVYLEQLGAYGKPGRDPRGRIITIAYLALVRPDLALQAGGDASHVQWLPLEDSLAEGLAFDHGQILVDARKRLEELVGSTDLARNLLPERFTVADYREVFEAILGRGLDPGNFRRQEFGKLEASGVLLSARGTRHTGTRPARLYRFKS